MKQAIVTGAGGGLGFSIFKSLSENNFSVAAVDLNLTDSEKTSDKLNNTKPYAADVRDEESIISLNEKIDLYYNFLISNHLTCLFAVWSLTIAGYVYLLGQIDRYSYWDWNGFYEGAIKLIISTVLFYVFVRANLLKQEKNRLSYIDIILNSGYYFSFFILFNFK